MQVNLHLAGAGLYCVMRDYLTLLRHLLQILGTSHLLLSSSFLFLRSVRAAGTAAEPILQAASLQTFFQPDLTPAGEKALKEMTDMLGGIGDSWSTALCINKTDIPGKRRKGSGWCEHGDFPFVLNESKTENHTAGYGWAGTYHFIDPETGVAAVLGSQLVPSIDPEVAKLRDRLEVALYAGLTA